MRNLAPNEKALFLILCGAVFLALNMLGLRSFLQARAKLQQALMTAKTELNFDRSWLELSDTLRPADNWINSHPMPQMPPDDASAELLKIEREEAEKAGLKVSEENLLPAQEGPQGSTVGVAVKLSGPFEGVVRLLFAIQTPTGWRTVEKLALRSDSQPPNVVADVELRQYFRKMTAGDSAQNPTVR